MNRLTTTSYKTLFFKHVFRFLGNVATLKERDGFHAIAVSGGVDSMVLLWFAHALFKQAKIGPIRAIFIHHHTRTGQDDDAELVKQFCQLHQIPFKMLNAKGLSEKAGNFEGLARKERRQLLLNDLLPKERLWLGQHIDDSFEWSVMQRYRSGLPKSSLGIPVRNGKIIRPFLCVTKAQLRTLASNEKIIYREDPTNKDTKYDRNFLREKIFPQFKQRYPKYLKHYVNHANHMAVILNLSLTNRVNDHKMHLYQLGAILQGPPFSPYQVQELLHTFSNSERGEISAQILKMLKAIDNEKKGPFHFSGGTEVYYSHKLLMIYQQKMKNYDLTIAKVLKGTSHAELMELPTFNRKDLQRAWENLTKTSDAMMNMPGLVLICEPSNVANNLNASVYDSLFPLTSEACKDSGYRFVTCLKCLERWELKKEKLPERLRLLPLWTLTNLFPSQAKLPPV